MSARVVTLLVPLCLLLLVAGQAVGQTRTRVQEYTPPYEVTDKDLSTIYGRYEIYEADKYRGGATTAAEAQAWVGQELIVTASLFRYPSGFGSRIRPIRCGTIPSNRKGMCPLVGSGGAVFILGIKSKRTGMKSSKFISRVPAVPRST